MTTRTILLRGPFTDADVTALYKLFQIIESEHPDRLYQFIIDDRNSTTGFEDVLAEFDKLLPKREGYERVKKKVKLKRKKRQPGGRG